MDMEFENKAEEVKDQPNQDFNQFTKSRTLRTDRSADSKGAFNDVHFIQFSNTEENLHKIIKDIKKVSDTPAGISRASSLRDHYNVMFGLISGFLAASSAGITLALIKILLMNTKISEFELIYQRSFIALIFVSLLIYLKNDSIFHIDRGAAFFAFARVIGSASGFMFEIFSLELIPLSKAILIVNNPFLTSIISYVLIGERITRHDLICFMICNVGVIFLTNPFSEKIADFKQWAGIVLAFLSSTCFNLSYVALRKIKDRPVNSWVLVFYIMCMNLLLMPSCFLCYEAVKNEYTIYTDKVWILLLLIGSLTLTTLYFTHMTFYYEKAGRGAAYTNFELIYTYLFDVFYMKNDFKMAEFFGAGLILVANLYLYVLKSLGIIM